MFVALPDACTHSSRRHSGILFCLAIEYKVVVIGLSNAGKTTLVYKMLLGA